VGDEDIGSGRQSPVPGQYLAGSTGIGKSWLACALGHKACRDNRSGQRVPKLFAELPLPSGDGRARILHSLIGVQLLILDDRGLEPLDAVGLTALRNGCYSRPFVTVL
jgi:DNA replication protein DnaC